MDNECKKCGHMWANLRRPKKNTCPICDSAEVRKKKLPTRFREKKKILTKVKKKKTPKGAETCQKCARLKRENNKLKKEIEELKNKQ